MRNKLTHVNLKFVLVIILYMSLTVYAQEAGPVDRAGLRSSTYGIKPFPDTTWWANVTADISSRYPGSSPAVIWIIGNTTNNGCHLGFPNPTPGTSYEKISFSSSDRNEAYFDAFDRKGIKVWLQIEPGFANIETLIDLVLTKYSHHPCITGFGVDAEWYKTSEANNDEGEAVTDKEAEAWVAKIKSYNENYLLFTKHWLISKMPPTFRNGIVFVDDSQIFSNMQSMIDEFEDWGKAFAPAKVAFQYGYKSDKPWWEKLEDPPKNIGDEIVKICPNVSDLFWVDFTAYDIWPINFIPASIDSDDDLPVPTGSELLQNYPNPFNPATKISYSVFTSEGTQHINLSVYDILGNQIAVLVNEEKTPGNYNILFDAASLCSGVYYCKLSAGNFLQTKKMLLLR
ncbi:MAG: T9SS type A sorting domain-containing protein [Ignavibacteriaceae bacterium]